MIECENLFKIYKTEDIEVVALSGLDLTVNKGELMAIIGDSGSGKSTLLNMIGGLDRPTVGKLYVNGIDLFKTTDKEMVNYKRDVVGFVWQNNSRNLIPYLTAAENVEMILRLKHSTGIKSRALELIDLVGLKEKANKKPMEMSGGEQQRIAIAIAIASEPKLLLGDEPTGSVDTKTAEGILSLFARLNKELGLTVVIVTHDRAISRAVDRVVAIRDGKCSSEFVRKNSLKNQLMNVSFEDFREEDKEELSVIDRGGRVQIPEDYLKALNLSSKDKIKIELQDNKVVLTPPV